MSAMLLPFVMINVVKNDEKAFDLFYKSVILSIFVASAYSIYLTTMPGVNPYLIATLPLSGREFNEAYSLAEGGGRIFGRISGVFIHPMTNGLFLSLSLIFVLYQISIKSVAQNKLNFVLNAALFVLIFLALLVIGIRTAIVSIGAGFFVYMFLEKNFKSAIVGISVIGVTFLIVQSIPELADYFGSIIDKDSSNITGSSIGQRLSQLNGAFDAIRDNILFGNGYGWTTFYEITRGSHPIMLSFESLFLVIICNNGLVGVALWMIMFIMYYFTARYRRMHKHSSFLLTLFSVYIIYAIVTGEYGYMKYFLIFYSLMWMQGRYTRQINQAPNIIYKNNFSMNRSQAVN
ncbi:MAG: O-antigen ligase family protein [Hydrogenophaga sp.]|nr:O-antigen ligase family protein [Hydrogenophaga sp.]